MLMRTKRFIVGGMLILGLVVALAGVLSASQQQGRQLADLIGPWVIPASQQGGRLADTWPSVPPASQSEPLLVYFLGPGPG